MVVLALLAAAGTIALSAPGANAPGSSLTGLGGSGLLAVDSAKRQGESFAQFFVPKQCEARDPGVPVYNGPRSERRVALTFDDGPFPSTSQFLDVLAQHDVDATFYVVGRYIPGNEAILRRQVAEGHAVENHTLNHENVAEGGKLAREEIEPTTLMITQATGLRPCTLRPPYGAFGPELEKYLRRVELDLIRWDVDTQDALGVGPEVILAQVKENLRPGAIILMHDGADNAQDTLAVLPQIIEFIRKKGYEMVTIPELLGLETDVPAKDPVPVTPPPDLEPAPESGQPDGTVEPDSEESAPPSGDAPAGAPTPAAPPIDSGL
jgi:peptidoglycan/xylan/chitin deacetylase (PgdA/CDA1 family)